MFVKAGIPHILDRTGPQPYPFYRTFARVDLDGTVEGMLPFAFETASVLNGCIRSWEFGMVVHGRRVDGSVWRA